MVAVRVTKTCAVCQIEQPLSRFALLRQGRGGHHSQCGDCRRDYYLSRTEGRRRRPPRPVAAPGYEYCSTCEREKPLDEFNRNCRGRSGKQNCCRACNQAYMREYNARPETQAQKRAQRREAAFGISPEAFDAMVERQGGLCAICLNPFQGKREPVVDHCHTTDAIRGLLCDRCNLGLGQFRDKPELLVAATLYLMRGW